MKISSTDDVFSESISEIYDESLVPMIFNQYAAEVSLMLSDLRKGALLEVAAGSGAVTRALAAMMPQQISITATDLNQAMIDKANQVGTARAIRWQQADVMDLPFSDASFDVVVCQFGAMFFEPKSAAFAEVRRVLCPGGQFIFSVWNGIELNEFAFEVTRSLADLFPDDPPRFFERIPYGYHHRQIIMNDLATAGFSSTPILDDMSFTSRASSARELAAAFCMGTPLRAEIEQRRAGGLSDVVDSVGASIERRFGASNLEGMMSAKFVSLKK
jgi:SAM-dependent methyltransferase